MNIDLISEKQVKTRKQHKCFACGRLFPVHSEMYRQTNKSEGEIYNIYTCPTCKQLMRDAGGKLYDYGEECFHNDCVLHYILENNVSTPEKWLEDINNDRRH